jgi:acyl dehydratase
MPIQPDLLGAKSDTYEHSWTQDDVILYALAVGAGASDPCEELAFTTENTRGVAPQVLPAFANIITRGARVDVGDYSPGSVLHGEQSFVLHASLPVAGRARTTATVVGLEDKGSGALVRTEAHAVDADTGHPLTTTTQSVFIRGAGGFGGARGASAPSPIPDREADYEVSIVTRPEQALLYRLTGDRNRLHSDPGFATRGGFDRPILHGMCTYGFAARVLLHTVCGGDPVLFHAMSGRFVKPVFPGDRLTVSVWSDGDKAYFRIDGPEATVLDHGVLNIGSGERGIKAGR